METLLFISTIICLLNPTSRLLGYDLVSYDKKTKVLTIELILKFALIILMLVSRLAVLVLSFVVFGWLAFGIVLASQLGAFYSVKVKHIAEVISLVSLLTIILL